MTGHVDKLAARDTNRLVWEVTHDKSASHNGALQDSITVHFKGLPPAMRQLMAAMENAQAEGYLPKNIVLMRDNARGEMAFVMRGAAIAAQKSSAYANPQNRLNNAIQGTAKMLGYGDRGGIDSVVDYIAQLPEIAGQLTLVNKHHVAPKLKA